MSATEHLLNALRETLRKGGRPRRGPTEVALLLAAFDQARVRFSTLREHQRAARGDLAERTRDAEHVGTLTRTLLARALDVRGATRAARQALEGMRLLALNAGLEGARHTDAGSASLLRLSDEMRARSQQGIDALEELTRLLEQLDRDRDKLRDAAAVLSAELAAQANDPLAEAALSDLEAALDEVGGAIEHTTGADPELAPLLAAAVEHARGLASALSQLATRDKARLALRSLQPLLDPLLSAIEQIYGSDEQE